MPFNMNHLCVCLLFVILSYAEVEAHEICKTVLDASCDCGSCSWLYKLKDECSSKNLAYCARHGYFATGHRVNACCQPDLIKVSVVVVAIAIVFGTIGLAATVAFFLYRGTFQGLLGTASGHITDDEPQSGYGYRVADTADSSPSKYRSALYNRASMYRDPAMGAPTSSSRQ